MTALSAGAPIAEDILQSAIDKARTVDFHEVIKAA